MIFRTAFQSLVIRHRPMTIIEHLETNLGLIAEGWKNDSAVGDVLQVVRFADQPFKGASTFSTIGLSESKVLQEHSVN